MCLVRVSDSKTHHHHLHSHPHLHNAAHWTICALLTGMFLYFSSHEEENPLVDSLTPEAEVAPFSWFNLPHWFTDCHRSLRRLKIK